jgi:hypothetical protein
MRITKLQLVRARGYDSQEWEKLYHNNQKEYIRKKLRFIADCVDLNLNFNRAGLSLKIRDLILGLMLFLAVDLLNYVSQLHDK